MASLKSALGREGATTEMKRSVASPKKPSVAMKSEAEEKRVDALEQDFVADFDNEEPNSLNGLTVRENDAILSNVWGGRTLVDALSNGRLLYPRLKPAEAAASKGKDHEQLWSYILRLESAKVDGRAEKARGGIHKSTAERIGETLGGVSGVGEGNGWYSRSRLAGGGVQYLDRGVESVVYDNGNGMVSKVRRITPSSINDMLDILGNIVYHNYLFPNDAYIVRDVVLDSENGIAGLYLVLWQKKVTPKTDPNGNIIAPSYADIFAHLARIPQKLKFVNDNAGEADRDESSFGDDSASVVPEAAKWMAYNENFLVYDFQPGRNTFIDAETGELRFIDPRVMLNDPGESFSKASKFGKRKPYRGNLDFGMMTYFSSDEVT